MGLVSTQDKRVLTNCWHLNNQRAWSVKSSGPGHTEKASAGAWLRLFGREFGRPLVSLAVPPDDC
jgi:hypothetical protein